MAAGLLMMVLAGLARAGGTEARVQVELMVPPLQRLDVDPPVVIMPEIQAEEIAAGFAELPRPIVLLVSSNAPWVLFLRWAGDGKAAPADEIPGAPRLQWAVGGGPFQPLAPQWAMLAAGGAPAEREKVELRLRVVLRPGETEPGLYQPRLEYRLAPAGE